MKIFSSYMGILLLLGFLSGCEMATGLSKMPFQMAGGLVPKSLVCQPSAEDMAALKTCSNYLSNDSTYLSFLTYSFYSNGRSYSLKDCHSALKGDFGTYGGTDPIYSCGIGMFTDEAYYFLLDEDYKKEWVEFNKLAIKRIEQLAKNNQQFSEFTNMDEYTKQKKQWNDLVMVLYSYESFLDSKAVNKATAGQLNGDAVSQARDEIRNAKIANADYVANKLTKNYVSNPKDKGKYATGKINSLLAIGAKVDQYIIYEPLANPQTHREVVAQTQVASQAVTHFRKYDNPEYSMAKAELEYAEKNFVPDAIDTASTVMNQLSTENYAGYAQTMLSDDNAGRRLDNLRDRVRSISPFIYEKETAPYNYSSTTTRVTKAMKYRITINLPSDGIKVSSIREVPLYKDFIAREGFSCKDISLLQDAGFRPCNTTNTESEITAFINAAPQNVDWNSFLPKILQENTFN